METWIDLESRVGTGLQYLIQVKSPGVSFPQLSQVWTSRHRGLTTESHGQNSIISDDLLHCRTELG
jgi:hypothetical protein